MQPVESAAWYVISLRPHGRHGTVRAAARRAGAGCLALSSLRIITLEDAATSARAAVSAGRCIFTSPAAVGAVAALLAESSPFVHALAVGSGTARALRLAGVREVIHPKRMDSEGLLALLGDVHGQRLGLVTGQGGRGLVEKTLCERGATVLRAEVYRRAPARVPPASLRRFDALERPAVVLATSGEALAALLPQFDADRRARFLRLPAVVPGERLAKVLAEAGFSEIGLARSPRPADLIAAARRLLR